MRLPLISFIVLVLAMESLAGCSHRRSIGRDEVKSEIRSARSWAAESEMFVDFVLQGHATRHYAEEHSTYLEDEVEQAIKELRQASPEPQFIVPTRECQAQMVVLARELSGIRVATGPGDRDALDTAKKKIREIRERLDKVSSQL